MNQPQEGLPKRVHKYQLTKLLGKGCFGKVYQGFALAKEKEKRARKYAIKELQISRMQPLEKIKKEAFILISISSPYIVFVKDVFQHQQFVYLVMDHLEGGDFKDYLKDNAPLPIHLAQKWFKQLCLGIKEIQDKGIIHRDLKPENILLSEKSQNGDCKIGDFGLSNYMDIAKSRNIGSPIYSAPEIFTQLSYNKNLDI